MTEEWRRVHDAPDYEVSSLGRVMSYRRRAPRLLKPGTNGGGYVAARLDGQLRYVHELVAEAFLSLRPEGLHVRHLDGVPSNNVVSNLAWGTRSENMRDRLRHGTDPYASRTHCPHGHPYDDENTYVRFRRGRPGRGCRACRATDSKRRTEQRRASRAA